VPDAGAPRGGALSVLRRRKRDTYFASGDTVPPLPHTNREAPAAITHARIGRSHRPQFRAGSIGSQ